MIRHIENLQPYFRTVLLPPSWETNTFHHLQVERSECWKAPGAIAWTDKVSVLVNDRKGKSGADLQDRRQPDSMLDMEAAPEKKTVPGVKWQLRPFIELDDRVLEIAEVGIAILSFLGVDEEGGWSWPNCKSPQSARRLGFLCSQISKSSPY